MTPRPGLVTDDLSAARRSPDFPAKGFRLMAHVVTAPCHDCKYTDCCVVCPVECFYQDDEMLYIDPVDCIDCEACVPECPVEAIFSDANTPAQWTSYIQLNNDRAQVLKRGDGHITDKHDPKEGPGCQAKA